MTLQNNSLEECIDNCLGCYETCLKTAMYCLRAGGKHAAPEHIRLLLDCAEICKVSADFMIRGSELHKEVCGVCADICKKCADDCSSFEDDTEMQSCADICRLCEQSCTEMSK